MGIGGPWFEEVDSASPHAFPNVEVDGTPTEREDLGFHPDPALPSRVLSGEPLNLPEPPFLHT